MLHPSEFYDAAVRAGFYGLDYGGLVGKKDNVRRIWEDMSIKLCLAEALTRPPQRRAKLRVADLGCGSGEGYELLTHIPWNGPDPTSEREFLLTPEDVAEYVGLDISAGMVQQGRANYAGRSDIRFEVGDLSRGFGLLHEPPFDLYFSSYASQSHISRAALEHLAEQLFAHGAGGALVVFDLLGRFSPEWPRYWSETSEQMLPYTMAYLLPPEARRGPDVDWVKNAFWSAAELRDLVARAAARARRRVEILALRDRSIFVGRHMDTGLLNDRPQPLRYQMNCLLDHSYRGRLDQLQIDLAWLESRRALHPEPFAHLARYATAWNSIIDLVAALMEQRDADVRALIESAEPAVADEMKMIAWLARNRRRFPVADPWASVVGPQVAVVLRNLELSLPDAYGCGHGLFAAVRVAE